MFRGGRDRGLRGRGLNALGFSSVQGSDSVIMATSQAGSQSVKGSGPGATGSAQEGHLKESSLSSKEGPASANITSSSA